MYVCALTIFIALLTSTIVFAYQGNLPMTIGFGLSTISLIIAVVGFTFMSIFHGFVVALSGIAMKEEKETHNDE